MEQGAGSRERRAGHGKSFRQDLIWHSINNLKYYHLNKKAMIEFRFQKLEIWHLSIRIADKLFDIADDLDKKHLYKFAEQLRAAGMSMSNNIAEGSGSSSNKDFRNFLNIAHRSTFENANITILLNRRQLVDQKTKDILLEDLDHLARKITNFRKTLR